MDQLIEALASLSSLTTLKDGVAPIQAIASSVGLDWQLIVNKIGDKEFSFDEAKAIIERFGEALKVGKDTDDDQSEDFDLEGDKPNEIIGVEFLQQALLKAVGYEEEK